MINAAEWKPRSRKRAVEVVLAAASIPGRPFRLPCSDWTEQAAGEATRPELDKSRRIHPCLRPPGPMGAKVRAMSEAPLWLPRGYHPSPSGTGPTGIHEDLLVGPLRPTHISSASCSRTKVLSGNKTPLALPPMTTSFPSNLPSVPPVDILCLDSKHPRVQPALTQVTPEVNTQKHAVAGPISHVISTVGFLSNCRCTFVSS